MTSVAPFEKLQLLLFLPNKLETCITSEKVQWDTTYLLQMVDFFFLRMVVGDSHVAVDVFSDINLSQNIHLPLKSKCKLTLAYL